MAKGEVVQENQTVPQDEKFQEFLEFSNSVKRDSGCFDIAAQKFATDYLHHLKPESLADLQSQIELVLGATVAEADVEQALKESGLPCKLVFLFPTRFGIHITPPGIGLDLTVQTIRHKAVEKYLTRVTTGLLTVQSPENAESPIIVFAHQNDTKKITIPSLKNSIKVFMQCLLETCVSQHLTEGCDDRTLLNAQGKNKYHCKPEPPPTDLILRGFSTCSPPTKEAYQHCTDLLRELWATPDSDALKAKFYTQMRELEHTVLAQLGFSVDDHSIFFHPSGTDSEFLPLIYGIALQRELGYSGGVVNVVTGAGEVGSKTEKAAGGRYIAPITPFGEPCTEGELLPEFPSTRVIGLKPRKACGDLALDYDNMVEEAVMAADKEKPDQVFVLHAVLGSKLGAVMPSEECVLKLRDQLGPKRVVIALDCCQLRHSPKTLHRWVDELDAITLITGSKFFCGPGFCGGCVVGTKMMKAIDELIPKHCSELMKGYGLYVTKSDCCGKSFPTLSPLLSDVTNFGMLTRWSCAKNEMLTFCPTRCEFEKMIPKWVSAVQSMVTCYPPLLTNATCPLKQFPSTTECLMGRCNTLVPIKPTPPTEDNKELSIDQLKVVYQWLMVDMSHVQDVVDKNGGAVEAPKAQIDGTAVDLALPEWKDVISQKCLIGQPVDLGPHGIVRIALGAPIAVKMTTDESLHKTLVEDAMIVWKLATLTKNFHQIVEFLNTNKN